MMLLFFCTFCRSTRLFWYTILPAVHQFRNPVTLPHVSKCCWPVDNDTKGLYLLYETVWKYSFIFTARKGYVFTRVCSVHRGGGEYLGRYPPEQCMLGDTGNKRAVRILLECILVVMCHRGRLTHLAFAYFSSHFTISSGDTLLLDKSMYPELYNIKKYRTPLNLLSLPQFSELNIFHHLLFCCSHQLLHPENYSTNGIWERTIFPFWEVTQLNKVPPPLRILTLLPFQCLSNNTNQTIDGHVVTTILAILVQ